MRGWMRTGCCTRAANGVAGRMVARFRQRPSCEALRLRMLPALVHNLNAVVVGIEDVGGVVARVVVQPGAWLAIVRSSHRDGCGVELVHLCLASCDEADVDRPGI